MATQRYTVYAYSPSLHQQVRQFDLAHVNADISKEQANQAAHYFAQLQNTNKYMHATDWQPLVQLESHGIDTIPGYIK
jgi:hypothetical protein